VGSFKLKLVAYFLLLSLLPILAAFWGFSSVAGQSETRRVDARLQSGLRSVLSSYQQRLDKAQSEANMLAQAPVFRSRRSPSSRATVSSAPSRPPFPSTRRSSGSCARVPDCRRPTCS